MRDQSLRRLNVDGRVKPTSVRHDLCLSKRTTLILLASSWLRIDWTGKDQRRASSEYRFSWLLKHIPWAVFDRLVDEHDADRDGRVVKSKAHLIAML